jgi:NAD(P)-dependent dehydrogenase (short-subunit alcohol dehydrogenase family)
MLHYVTSKGGIMAFTRALSRELGEHGIRVNTLSPGFTLSDTVMAENPRHVEMAGKLSVAGRAIRRDAHPQDLLAGIMQRFDCYTAQALHSRDPFLFSRDCRRGASSPATSQRAGWRRFAG